MKTAPNLNSLFGTAWKSDDTAFKDYKIVNRLLIGSTAYRCGGWNGYIDKMWMQNMICYEWVKIKKPIEYTLIFVGLCDIRRKNLSVGHYKKELILQILLWTISVKRH